MKENLTKSKAITMVTETENSLTKHKLNNSSIFLGITFIKNNLNINLGFDSLL